MGHVIGALERLDTLQTKLGKFATEMGPAALRAFGFNNKAEFVEKNFMCYEAILDLSTCLQRLVRSSQFIAIHVLRERNDTGNRPVPPYQREAEFL